MKTFKMIVKTSAILVGLMPMMALAQDGVRDTAAEEANRVLVVDFYNSIFNDHDMTAADVVAEDYIQHNPQVPDGKAPFVAFFTQFFAENPESSSEVVRSAADGDLVWLHVKTGGNPTVAIVDIYRVQNGKIVEHWDVLQEVPTESANDNTMF